MRMLIKNGRVIDPASNTDDIRDILVEDGVIAEVAKDIDKAADTVIDAKGCMVMPGLVDLHVHFREPGFEHKETIKTGSRAAAAGAARMGVLGFRIVNFQSAVHMPVGNVVSLIPE